MELFGKKLLCHLVISQEDIEQLLHSITPQIEELAPSTFLTLYFLPDMVDILKLSVTRVRSYLVSISVEPLLQLSLDGNTLNH